MTILSMKVEQYHSEQPLEPKGWESSQLSFKNRISELLVGAPQGLGLFYPNF